MELAGAAASFRSRFPGARSEYIATTARVSRQVFTDQPHPSLDEQRRDFRAAVALLEMFYIAGIVWDFCSQHGIRSDSELRDAWPRLDQHLRVAVPDLDDSLGFVHGIVAPPETTVTNTTGWPDQDNLARQLQAIVVETPIDAVEHMGRILGEAGLAHRARRAFDALSSLVRRTSLGDDKTVRIVGDLYQRGELRLQDAAQLLGVTKSDAVFVLEAHGYARPVDCVRLTDAQRAAILAQIREPRSPRSERVVDPDLVRRDVVASARIEGVDARSWIVAK